ncbi:hypothetical protein [Protaetiibacter larvae]|uniref:Uncharacterized protein n=1 Tax=Protaetiibacter larvae TaxID=2592654 RepID=A0A5C1Y4R4_9MICO|nr:hypothetical protein [Protaetiibacter larvae]QEO09023.1 hypothetical protein FLP23_02720 [Protaetiibacter larvae]
MPADPLELDRLRARLAELHQLYRSAQRRAADPPLIGAESWRGPAYAAYAVAAEHLGTRLHEVLDDLAGATAIARAELLHALA